MHKELPLDEEQHWFRDVYSDGCRNKGKKLYPIIFLVNFHRRRILTNCPFQLSRLVLISEIKSDESTIQNLLATSFSHMAAPEMVSNCW